MIQKTSKTVILCDDEPAIIENLSDLSLWKELGLDIIATADTGLTALDCIFELEPDIAVIDIHMPHINGIKLLEECKKQKLKTEFIILSGYDDFSYAKDAIKFGARAYLLKPINKLELYDELLRILDTLDTAKNSNSQHSSELVTNVFNNMLNGGFTDERLIQSVLQNHGITLKNTSNYCLAIEPKTDDELSLQNLIKNLDVVLSDSPHFLLHYQNYLVGIFNETNEISFKTANRISDFISQSTGQKPLIGIGDTSPTLSGISYSYVRAVTAMTYRLYQPEASIFISDIICDTPPVKSLADIEYLPLIQFIVKNDDRKIAHFVDSFIGELLYVRMPPPNYVFSTCYALFHTIEKEFSQYMSDEIHIVSNTNDLYTCKSIEEIKQWLKNSFINLSKFIDAIYGYSSSKHNSALDFEDDDKIIQDSVKYIRDNLTKNIKISDIAKQVHLSPSYFAIYFKNKTKVNLRDFILDEKMEYARKELLYNNTPVTDIAYSLGYGDYRSFSRAFKNIHHKTPTEFRLEHTH